jgi:hypothetical protein
VGRNEDIGCTGAHRPNAEKNMIVGKTILQLTVLAPQGNVVPTFGKLLRPRFAAAATSSADSTSASLPCAWRAIDSAIS